METGVLSCLESVMDGQAEQLDPAGLPGIQLHQLAGGSVPEVASGIAKSLV